MPKKDWTEEERKAFGEKMKAARAARQAVKKPKEKITTSPFQEQSVTTNQSAEIGDQTVEDLKRQVEELKNLFISQAAGQSTAVKGNKIVGTTERFSVDPKNYTDPTPRLMKEPRLSQFAFDVNYVLDYDMKITTYETKDGLNMKEPRFHVELRRKVYDDDGNLTNKQYIVRKLVFHEDPETAVVIARDNGLEVDENNETDFLNEMRYLRVRDWLLGIFFPQPAQESQAYQEEVVGGKLVSFVTVNSENNAKIPFGDLNKSL